MSARRIALLFCCTVAASACLPLLYDDSCGPEFRITTVQGPLRDAAGTRIGGATLELIETREDSVSRRYLLGLMGPAYGDPGPLSGHVTAVRLVAGTAILREFSFLAGNEHEIVRVAPGSLSDADFTAWRQRALSGELTLELQTSIPGLARIATPLPLQHAGNWDRAHCS